MGNANTTEDRKSIGGGPEDNSISTSALHTGHDTLSSSAHTMSSSSAMPSERRLKQTQTDHHHSHQHTAHEAISIPGNGNDNDNGTGLTPLGKISRVDRNSTFGTLATFDDSESLCTTFSHASTSDYTHRSNITTQSQPLPQPQHQTHTHTHHQMQMQTQTQPRAKVRRDQARRFKLKRLKALTLSSTSESSTTSNKTRNSSTTVSIPGGGGTVQPVLLSPDRKSRSSSSKSSSSGLAKKKLIYDLSGNKNPIRNFELEKKDNDNDLAQWRNAWEDDSASCSDEDIDGHGHNGKDKKEQDENESDSSCCIKEILEHGDNGMAWDTPPTSPTDAHGYARPNLEMFSLLRVLGKGSFGKVCL